MREPYGPSPRNADSPPLPGSTAEWLGEGGLSALCADWCQRVLDDPAVARWHAGLGPAQQARMIAFHRGYLAEMLGGPPCHGGDLLSTHGPLEIDQPMFDRVREHLRVALRSAGLSRPAAGRILARVAALAPQVVTGYRPPR